MKKTPNKPPSDRLGFIVRFICGAIAGIILALSWGLISITNLGITSIIFGIMSILIFGGLAARWGDKFWFWLSDMLKKGWF